MSFFDRLFERDGKKLKSEDRRRLLRSTVAAGLFTGLSMLGFIPVIMRWRQRLRPPGAICRTRIPRRLHQMRAMRPGLPGQGHPSRRHRRGLWNRQRLFSTRANRAAISPATPCNASWPARPARCRTTPRPRNRCGWASPGLRGRIAAWRARAAASRASRAANIRTSCTATCRSTAGSRSNCRASLRSRNLRSLRARMPDQGRDQPWKADRRRRDKRKTPVVHRACVGCGFCEMICPAEPAAIVVDARAVWPAQQGA